MEPGQIKGSVARRARRWGSVWADFDFSFPDLAREVPGAEEKSLIAPVASASGREGRGEEPLAEEGVAEGSRRVRRRVAATLDVDAGADVAVDGDDARMVSPVPLPTDDADLELKDASSTGGVRGGDGHSGWRQKLMLLLRHLISNPQYFFSFKKSKVGGKEE